MSDEIINTEFEVLPEETPVQIEEVVIESVPELPRLSDIVLAVGLFLQDKQELLDSGDNWNPTLLEVGDQSGWRFKNIPCPSLEELKALLDSQEVVE